ncbi:MAG: tRNA (guanosine(46)-N7)-methyltransferase TrmB [Bacteroidetes bacterium]|nr:tRNA (guanosine(46)-N7)-methyltransferase TrmB [Bacteroidota bacterium]
MPKNKLKKYGEINSFQNLFQYGFHDLEKDDFPLKGKWNQDFFKNKSPIVLELGCGKGEYTNGLAENNLDRNYIGVDIKGARLWRGAKTSSEKELTNTAFIRTMIELIDQFFVTDEVSEIWIAFPDPQPKSVHEHKRLISPKFLTLYKKFLTTSGIIHLKTDNTDLYEYCLEVIKECNHEILLSTSDLYNSGIDDEVISVQTYYETSYLEQGKKINYLKFRLYD